MGPKLFFVLFVMSSKEEKLSLRNELKKHKKKL